MSLAKKIVNEYRIKNLGKYNCAKFTEYMEELIHKDPYKIIKNKNHFNELIKNINLEIEKVLKIDKDNIFGNLFTKFDAIQVSRFVKSCNIRELDTIQHYFIDAYVNQYCAAENVTVVEDFRFVQGSVDALASDIIKKNEINIFSTEEEALYHKSQNKKTVTMLTEGVSADIYILHLECVWNVFNRKQDYNEKIHSLIRGVTDFINPNGIIVVLINAVNDYIIKSDMAWKKMGFYPMFAYMQAYNFSLKFSDDNYYDEDDEIHTVTSTNRMYLDYSNMLVLRRKFTPQCAFAKINEDINSYEALGMFKSVMKGDVCKYIFYRDNSDIKNFSFKDNLAVYYKNVEERKRLNEGYRKLDWADLFKSSKISDSNSQFVVISLIPHLLEEPKVFFNSEEEYKNYFLSGKKVLKIGEFSKGEKWISYIYNHTDNDSLNKIKDINLIESINSDYNDYEDIYSNIYLDEYDTKLGVLLNTFFYLDTENNALREKNGSFENAEVIQRFGKNHEYDFNKSIYQYRLTDSIISKFIKSTYIKMKLDINVVLKDYFFTWLDCDDGKEYERECQKIIYKNKNKIIGGNYEPLKKLYLTVPEINMQRVLLSNLKKIEDLKSKIHKMTSDINALINISPSQNNVDFYMMEKDLLKLKNEATDYYNSLPQPLATILYYNYCEIEISRKVHNYLDFFESTAAFVAIFLLSLAYSKNTHSVLSIIKHTFLYRDDNKDIINYRITFGTWTKIIEMMIQLNKKQDVSNPDNVRGTDSVLLNRLYIVISETNGIRNKLSHCSRRSYDEEKKDLLLYESITYNMVGLLIGLFKGYEFVHGINIITAPDTSDSDVRYYGYSMQGYSQRMKVMEYSEIKQDIKPDLNKVYIRDKYTNHFYSMLPLIRYRNLIEQDSSLKASYYINRFEVLKEKGEIGDYYWKSYDSITGEDQLFFDSSLHKLLKNVLEIDNLMK